VNFRDSKLKYKTAIALFLTAAIVAIYWQTGEHSFVFFDDEEYVLHNSRLLLGFTLENIKWFLTSSHAANWHPLTWFSHILDVNLFGLNPLGHHFVSVALHWANSLLLYLFLYRFTGSLWRSATVAALFAVHPLNVESVAWISERKNVLSTLFWLLTLYLYSLYTEKKSRHLYSITVIVFALGLMAKQMLVSIPLVLLLLDYWPLQRIRAKELKSLLLEKVPFLLLAIIAAIITILSQQQAINSLQGYSLARRFANAATSYLQYLRKTFWPDDLAIFYPFPDAIDWWTTIAATLLLVAITATAIKLRRRYPALFIGWFWYLLTLLPVIGIVKIGLQSMADRYAYIPTIGIFVATVWCLADLSRDTPRRKLLSVVIAGAAIFLLALTAWRQTSYWQDTNTLFTYTLAKTKKNYIALCAIGRELDKQGEFEAAMQKFDEALEAAPWYDAALTQQGIMLMKRGMFADASSKFQQALQLNSASIPAHINLGIVLALLDRPEEAIPHFQLAIDLDTRSAAAHYNLAFTLQKLGKPAEAIRHYAKALQTDPFDHECHNNMGVTLANMGRYDEAIQHFSEALRLKPEFSDARNNLEITLKKQAAAN
jgi:tetratricopeptide (TPR) repeat protein